MGNYEMMKKLSKIVVRRYVDTDPDLSYLEQDYPDCTSHQRAAYKSRDAKRLAKYGAYWFMIGIRAEVMMYTSEDGENWLSNKLTSGGLWCIESDSGEEYLNKIETEELTELMAILDELGFPANDRIVEYNRNTVYQNDSSITFEAII